MCFTNVLHGIDFVEASRAQSLKSASFQLEPATLGFLQKMNLYLSHTKSSVTSLYPRSWCLVQLSFVCPLCTLDAFECVDRSWFQGIAATRQNTYLKHPTKNLSLLEGTMFANSTKVRGFWQYGDLNEAWINDSSNRAQSWPKKGLVGDWSKGNFAQLSWFDLHHLRN